MRVPVIGKVVLVALLAVPEVAAAQGAFGIGGRLTWVRRDVDIEEDSTRFTGGHIRARLSPKTAFELSLDVHTETNALETARVREYPIQASLLLFPVRTVFSPYLLGGGGNDCVGDRSRLRVARGLRCGTEARRTCRSARRLSLYLPRLRER
jgi:hypothetical protein